MTTTKTTTFSDLPVEVVGKIFNRVPITSLGSVRSTCMKWEDVSKKHMLAGATKIPQFLGFILTDLKVHTMKFDLQGIHEDGDDDFIQPSVNEVSELDEYEISQIFHCDGLLLCVFQDNIQDSRLMVWNMYTDQTRWIKPSGVLNLFTKHGVYALGYDDSNKKRNHKILRNRSLGGSGYEVYDFESDSWRVIESTIDAYTDIEDQGGLSLKGNAYFLAVQEFPTEYETVETRVILLFFDFTKEIFEQRITLPFYSEGDGQDYVSLSCVRDEQLAVLYQQYKTIKIWISTSLEDKGSWSLFLEVDLLTLNIDFPNEFRAGSFFIDEEKQVAVVFEKDVNMGDYHTAYIIGQDGYSKAVNIRDAPAQYYRCPILCTTAYVPSLVNLKKNVKKSSAKRKKRDY